MGTLADFFERLRAAAKLERGRCEGCGKIFRDDHPANQRACSSECAENAWFDRQ